MTTKMFLGFLLFFLLSFHASSSFLPSFSSPFDVVEECPPGTLISGVAEYLKQIMLVTVEMPNSTTYQLMGTDPFTKSFVINPKTGELRTVGRIDRESICTPDVTSRNDLGIDSSCLKSLNVLINSRGIDGAARSSMRTQIMLRIVDINDNSPKWPGKRMLTVRFVEAFQSGTSFGKQEMTTQSQLLDRAVDPDAGPNGTVSYSLKGNGADMFRLEYPDLDNGRYDQQDINSPLRLKPVVPLDREMFEYYNLTLYAFDAGNPQRSSSIPLDVYVTDFNDHAPVFHSYNSGHSAYSRDNKQGDSVRIIPERTHLMETARIGSEVLQLNATDEDSGENARITYSIFPGDAALVQPYFDLDPISGILRVRQRLDYDSGPRKFKFKVLAVDGAPEPIRLTGTASVEIELTDYNDEPPNIEILIPQNGNLNGGNTANINGGITPILSPGGKYQEQVAFIEESPSPDIVIAYVQVSDMDENGEDQVECHLGPRDNFTLQADSPSSGGKSDHFGFDSGASLSDRLGKRISEYRILAKVPSDHSSGSSSSLQNRLDRETTPTQLLTIICKDRNGNQAERRIRLHLLDINDNPPKFINDSYFNFSVAENREPVGNQQVWLGRVQAFDSDLGENARITYHLAPEQNGYHDGQFASSAQQLFRVQPDTGDIYAQVSLDRENAPDNGVYSMNILAVDHGKPQLTGTARVDVTVLDVNDWPPEFTRDIYTFEVPEDLELREVVGVVEAVDRDTTAGPNTITYRLNPPRSGIVQRSLGNESLERVKRDSMPLQQQPLFMPHLEPSKVRDERPLSYFSIDSRTGEIRVIRKLDRETNSYFTFEVLAIDSPLSGSSQVPMTQSSNQIQQGSRRGFKGGETFTATATVVVTLTDVNDNAPEFRYPNTSILLHMAPGETLGHGILTVQAVDADYGENARISYNIRSEIPNPPDGPGAGNFGIGETNGLIFLTKPIQGPVNHRLVVEACDHGVQPKCTSSPPIQIAVSEDAKLAGDGNSGVVGGSGGVLSSTNGGLGSRGLDRSNSDPRYSNLDGFYGGFYDQAPPPHRVEVIAACLVVVFGVLLLAAIVLVCLLKRRPLVNGQHQRGQQNPHNQQQRFDYACTPLWNCQWSLFKHQKNANSTGKRGAQHYGPNQVQEGMNDPRFSDAQSIGSSVAKGMLSTDSITNALEEEKKPLYYDGLGVLALDSMGHRGMRQPVEYSTAGGNGGMQVPVVFTGNPPRVYGTLPVVSTILSDGHNAGGTLMARPCFHQRSSRAHPQTNITPPSPDYQSLDQLASRPVWQTGGVDMFTSPRNNRQINNLPPSTSTSSYGCLIDPPRRNNYYEVSNNTSTNQCHRQRSATLGRLVAMTEETDNEEEGGQMGGGKRRQGMLGSSNNATTRSYSQLQATTTGNIEESEEDRDRPTRYTYQAIREASFV